LLVLFGLGLLLLNIFGSSILPFGSGFTESSLTQSETFEARNLRLSIGSGNVTLERGDDDQIQVEIVRHGYGWNRAAAERSAEQVMPEIRQDGDTVNIEGPERDSFVLFGQTPYIDYHITVPEDAEINARAGSGDIRAEELAGPLEIQTGSGNIQLRDVEGRLTIDVGSGDITVDNAVVEKARLQTGSGNISLDEVRGSLKAHTGSGDVQISNAEDLQMDLQTGSGNVNFDGSLSDNGESRVQARSGDIELTLASDTNAQVEAQTSSGDISSEWDLDGNNESRRGEIGSGGAELTISTSSGNITLQHN
jgi:DUF4097 and DUF4098 domain-containing protein YvlB